MAERELDFYRVQADKRWLRRKWQAEWPDCRWAQRGYTRPGIRAMVRVRRSHPAVNEAYTWWKIMIRRYVTQRAWYAACDNRPGRRRGSDG